MNASREMTPDELEAAGLPRDLHAKARVPASSPAPSSETEPIRIGPESASIACEECGGLFEHRQGCSEDAAIRAQIAKARRELAPPSRGTEPEDGNWPTETERELAIGALICAEADDEIERGWARVREIFARYDQAVAAIRGYVSRLRNQTPCDGDENIASDFWATVARDGHGFVRTQDEWDTLAAYAREQAAELASLRSQLSHIQQTGLTRDEAETLLLIEKWATKGHRAVTMKDVEASALAKLRSLAALRSLEGDGK